MPSLLRREDRSALGAHRGPIVVITHTHTMRSRAALILAREQLSLHPSLLFHHHVALRADSQARCATMRAMLPFSENVSCIGASTIAALLPAIGQSGRLFSRQKPKSVEVENEQSRASWAQGADLGVGSYQWSWSNCDATYLGWAALSGLASTQHARWFWFLEWDVTWSGNIATILAAYHGYSGEAGGRPSKGRARSEDLLCDVPLPARPQTTAGYKHMKNRRGLPHFIERNRSEYAFDVVWTCVIQLARLSARLLRHVIAQSRRPEHGLFCEMRAATMCSMMADSVHPPCVIGNVAHGRQERFFETRRRLHDAKRHPTFNWHTILLCGWFILLLLPSMRTVPPQGVWCFGARAWNSLPAALPRREVWSLWHLSRRHLGFPAFCPQEPFQRAELSWGTAIPPLQVGGRCGGFWWRCASWSLSWASEVVLSSASLFFRLHMEESDHMPNCAGRCYMLRRLKELLYAYTLLVYLVCWPVACFFTFCVISVCARVE